MILIVIVFATNIVVGRTLHAPSGCLRNSAEQNSAAALGKCSHA